MQAARARHSDSTTIPPQGLCRHDGRGGDIDSTTIPPQCRHDDRGWGCRHERFRHTDSTAAAGLACGAAGPGTVPSRRFRHRAVHGRSRDRAFDNGQGWGCRHDALATPIPRRPRPPCRHDGQDRGKATWGTDGRRTHRGATPMPLRRRPASWRGRGQGRGGLTSGWNGRPRPVAWLAPAAHGRSAAGRPAWRPGPRASPAPCGRRSAASRCAARERSCVG